MIRRLIQFVAQRWNPCSRHTVEAPDGCAPWGSLQLIEIDSAMGVARVGVRVSCCRCGRGFVAARVHVRADAWPLLDPSRPMLREARDMVAAVSAGGPR